MVYQVIICGTGTNVGKTHVTCALLHALRAQDRSCVALKPVETGIGAAGSDHALLAAGAEPVFPLYAYEEPLSPHLAARHVGAELDMARMIAWIADHRDGAEWVLIETAGGLFSPLTPAVTNFELVQSLGPAAVVLVVPDRIGCFHDLIACLRAAGGALDPLLVVFTAAPPSDLSTGQNMPELQVLGYDGPVWSFPAGAPNDAASREVADQLIAAIAAPREAVAEE